MSAALSPYMQQYRLTPADLAPYIAAGQVSFRDTSAETSAEEEARRNGGKTGGAYGRMIVVARRYAAGEFGDATRAAVAAQFGFCETSFRATVWKVRRQRTAA